MSQTDAELELRLENLAFLAKHKPEKYTDKEVARRIMNIIKARDAAKEQQTYRDVFMLLTHPAATDDEVLEVVKKRSGLAAEWELSTTERRESESKRD